MSTRFEFYRETYAVIYGEMPFSRFTKDPQEIAANRAWCKEADAWGEYRDPHKSGTLDLSR